MDVIFAAVCFQPIQNSGMEIKQACENSIHLGYAMIQKHCIAMRGVFPLP